MLGVRTHRPAFRITLIHNEVLYKSARTICNFFKNFILCLSIPFLFLASNARGAHAPPCPSNTTYIRTSTNDVIMFWYKSSNYAALWWQRIIILLSYMVLYVKAGVFYFFYVFIYKGAVGLTWFYCTSPRTYVREDKHIKLYFFSKSERGVRTHRSSSSGGNSELL